jgi:peptide/nickel transport system substrate-binding protein
VAQTPTAQANWWDKFGEPKYGGTLLLRTNSLALDLDPATTWGGLYGTFGDFLWNGDWTLDRGIWSFQTAFAPDDCWAGCLAETWEMSDALTLTVHLRHGVHWQNKAPVNGREFIADDVQQHYDRILGTGSGYTEPNPFHYSRFDFLDKVVATDKYTVAFELKKATAAAFIGLAEQAGQNWVEAPELVKMDGGFEDWKNSIGTGPWLLTDYVDGSSVTYTKNPDYWGYDERYPQNQLPYADEMKSLVIPDTSTAIAAMRTDKIFMLGDLFWTQAQTLTETNPELEKIRVPSPGQGIIMTVDKTPFDNILVRKALQLSVDRETIAKTHYGGVVDGTPCGIVSPLLKGYDYPYEDWPQELKDEYSYNPEKAKQLLAEAGYPNGFSTNCPIGSMLDMELAQIIKSYFSDINVDMELTVMDPTTFMDFSRAKKQDQLIWTGAACARVFPPKLCISGFYSTDMANYANVKDPNYDAICDNFLACTDVEQSKQLVQDAVKYALEHHWLLTVVPQANFSYWQPYLKGYSGESGSYVFARLWIDQG